jgi:hypothetical protein
VKRKWKPIRKSEDGKTILLIDELNMKSITTYLGQDDRHKSKFKDIVQILMEGLNNSHLYKREIISDNIKDITAMRFFVGQENDRIYCKEISQGETKIIIMGVLLLHKKEKKNTKREIKEIEKLSGYEYEEYI